MSRDTFIEITSANIFQHNCKVYHTLVSYVDLYFFWHNQNECLLNKSKSKQITNRKVTLKFSNIFQCNNQVQEQSSTTIFGNFNSFRFYVGHSKSNETVFAKHA